MKCVLAIACLVASASCFLFGGGDTGTDYLLYNNSIFSVV